MRAAATLVPARTTAADRAALAVRDVADLDEAIDELREVAHGLYPPVLSRMGLLNALEHVRYHATTPIAIDASGLGRHPAELEAAVYYCCLEAIQNATKHGPGLHVSVALREPDNQLTFEVTDDGPGFDPSDAHGGMGLQNMRDPSAPSTATSRSPPRSATAPPCRAPSRCHPTRTPANAHVGGGHRTTGIDSTRALDHYTSSRR